MDPNTGHIISAPDLKELQKYDPEKAAKFSVMLEGSREDVERIAEAVRSAHASRAKADNRRKNRAARAARRANR